MAALTGVVELATLRGTQQIVWLTPYQGRPLGNARAIQDGVVTIEIPDPIPMPVPTEGQIWPRGVADY